MTSATTNTIAPRSTSFNLSAFFRTYFARRNAYKQTFSELASLSDRELKDIGIARGNIRHIAQEHAATV